MTLQTGDIRAGVVLQRAGASGRGKAQGAGQGRWLTAESARNPTGDGAEAGMQGEAVLHDGRWQDHALRHTQRNNSAVAVQASVSGMGWR